MASHSTREFSLLFGGILLTAAALSGGQSQELANGSFPDVEGRAYRTTRIGAQLWMAENLSVSRYANGDPIPQVRDARQWESLTTGAWCFYDNNQENGEKYGKLYNWYAVNDPRGLAPEGWHVPTEEDWVKLEVAMGMEAALGDAEGWFGTTQGVWLKSSSGWVEGGNGIDSVGFSALPSGFRGLEGSFYLIGRMTAFWSASQSDWDYVWYRSLAADESAIRRKLGTAMRGFAVRLVRDSK